jgi:hypothetical protein
MRGNSRHAARGIRHAVIFCRIPHALNHLPLLTSRPYQLSKHRGYFITLINQQLRFSLIHIANFISYNQLSH